MSTSTFPPVEALRLIGRVCADRDLGPAQRLAIIRVVLYAANDTGLAWAAYRAIRRETGLAAATIRAALRLAEGRYLARDGIGPNGAVRYRALQSVKRASTTEARAASTTEAPALQSLARGATVSEAKLAPVTNPRTSARGMRPSAVTWNEDANRFEVPDETLRAWRDAYPAVDVAGELRKAAAWHAANRTWRSRFSAALVRWLTRAAEQTNTETRPRRGGRGPTRFTAAAGSAGQYAGVAQTFEEAAP